MLNSLFWGTITWALTVLIIGLSPLGTSAWGISLIVFSALVIYGVAFAWRPVKVNILYALAEKNKGITLVNEATAKAIIEGGRLVEILIQWNKHTFDNEYNVTPGEFKPKKARYIEGVWWFENPFAQAKQVAVYNWKRSFVDEQGHIHNLDTRIDFIPLAEDTYWGKLIKSEDANKMPLDVEFLLTIQIVNPYKALFNVGATMGMWLEVVMARILTEARDVLTEQTYDNWITSTQALGDRIMERFGTEKVLKEVFEDTYGVKLVNIGIKQIDPPDDYRRLTTLLFTAEREAAAAVKTAEGEAKAVGIAAGAEKQRLETVYGMINEYGDAGRLLRALEAAERSPLAASLSIQSIPGLQNLGNLFGGAGDSQRELRDQIAELRKIVEDFIANNGNGKP